MRILLVIISLLISFSGHAQTQIKTQIHDIDMGKNDELSLIFLSSGDVVSYPIAKARDLEKLQEGIRKKTWFLLSLNKGREIIGVEEISMPLAEPGQMMKLNQIRSIPYSPSILSEINEARTLFLEARTDAREESQCFNRAHIWAYEWRIKRNFYSSKAWLFFTKKFIRKYKFQWWFHVAPMVHVVQDGEVKERIMDIKYAKGPLKLKQWTDIFLRDNADCPVVKKYTDQADYPESGSCFVMKSSMYYYQPVDLELLEFTNDQKSKWLENEVRGAYFEAFNVNF
jgi:Glutaminase